MIWCTQIRSHFENIYHLSSRRHFFQFNVNKATGVDDIPLRIFGIFAKELFNLSFSMGEVSLCQYNTSFKANAIENVEIDLFPCYKILGKRQERIVHWAISRMYHLFSLISSMAS